MRHLGEHFFGITSAYLVPIFFPPTTHQPPVLVEAERRGFKGPRVYDATGLPLHFDNQSIFKERIYRDKTDPNTVHDEVTVIDHALTRPWTVDKRYVHNPNPHPEWREGSCVEGSGLVAIGREMYVLRGDGLLMPAKEGQPPPDLRFFKPR